MMQTEKLVTEMEPDITPITVATPTVLYGSGERSYIWRVLIGRKACQGRGNVLPPLRRTFRALRPVPPATHAQAQLAASVRDV